MHHQIIAPKKTQSNQWTRLLRRAGASLSHYWRAGIEIVSRHCCRYTWNLNIAETQQISEKEEPEWDVLQRDLDRGHGSARTARISEPRWCGRLCIDDPDVGRRDPVKDVTHSGA